MELFVDLKAVSANLLEFGYLAKRVNRHNDKIPLARCFFVVLFIFGKTLKTNMVKIFCLCFFIIKDTNFMKLVKKKKQVY